MVRGGENLTPFIPLSKGEGVGKSSMQLQQLTLPKFDLRRICPVCQQPKSEFRRWHPYRAWSEICIDCSTLAPAYELLDTTRDGREHRVLMESELHAMTHKSKPSVVLVASCRVIHPIQLEFPICLRCGKPHTNWKISLWSNHCQRCEDEMSVESFFDLLPKIKPGRDVEDYLDDIYRSHRGLFDRGVLPDYWFVLAAHSLCLE
jgi:hypothetical protein